MANHIILGDSLSELRKLPSESYAVCVTSPPYNGGWTNPASKAGRKGSVGAATRWRGEYDGFNDALPPDEYIVYHRAVISEVLRVLQPDGVLWYVHKRRPRFDGTFNPALVDMVLSGYPVRSEIIWYKGKPGVGFCAAGRYGGCYYPTPAFESVFLLPKSRAGLLDRELAAKGDVWTIPNKRENGAKGHPAAFPRHLVTRCLEMTLAQGAVIDPFGGSGTTGLVAAHLGREYTLIEQNPDYVKMAQDRLGG